MKPPTNYSPDSLHYYGAPHSVDEIELDYFTRAKHHTEEMLQQYHETAQAYRVHCRQVRLWEFLLGLLLGLGLIQLLLSL